LARKKPRKVRIAFRKNRQRRARVGDVTRDVRKDDIETVDLPSVERISGKGDLTRYRTILSTEEGGADALRAVDETTSRMGRVLSATGLNCLVSDAAAGGRVYECTVRRVVRTMSRDQRGAVVAGDSVLFQPIDREHGVIERINPRRSVLNRGTKGKEQVIAANLETLFPDMRVGAHFAFEQPHRTIRRGRQRPGRNELLEIRD